MIIRLRTPNRLHRVEVQESDTLDSLKQKILNLEPNESIFELYLMTEQKEKIPLKGKSATLKAFNLKHGDMIYVDYTPKNKEEIEEKKENEIQEDPIDKELAKRDGWIERQRDPKICQHGTHGRCTFCMPVPPWDFINHDPWKSEGIKFISFHSYLKKVLNDSGCKHPESQKCLNCKSLSIPSYRLKECSKHPPWPEGICTECQPSACRIDSQSYRHVDRVIFDTPQIVDKFLEFWRQTGTQRCGYLYGKYMIDDHIPLGIQAVVSAIYETPQKNTKEGSTLERDENAERIEIVAQMLGLQRIGYIWTDLQTDNTKRIIQSRVEYPLTGKEIISMAKMQNRSPSFCKQAGDGILGSKFVSILITGTAQGEISVSAYQVSDQCMQLVKDGIITFSSDPSLLRTKKTTKRFIPDVMYRKQNEYGREVVEKASPTFPPEFFIVRLGESAAKKPNPLFKTAQFPIENRSTQLQSLSALKSQIYPFDTSLKIKLSDFHLILYLSSQINQSYLATVLDYVFKEANNLSQVRELFEKILPRDTPSVTKPKPSPPTFTSNPSPPTFTSNPSPPTFTSKQQEAIKTLVDMGFDKDQSITVLIANDWKLEPSIELLTAMLS